jgi:hypothetical protein
MQENNDFFSKSGVDEGRTTRFFPSLASQLRRLTHIFNSSNAGHGNGAPAPPAN